MADRWAFLVAIEKPLDPSLGVCPFAETQAQTLVEALTPAGYPKANQIVLLGPQATRTAILSRVRKLKKAIRKGDELLVFWTGPASETSKDHLFTVWDTLADDRTETSFSFAELSALLTDTKARQTTLLWNGWMAPSIAAYEPNLVVLAAAEMGETALTTPALKGSLWTHLVIESFRGAIRSALDAQGQLTTGTLQRTIEQELPRLLRKHLEPGLTQTPHLAGSPSVVLADLSTHLNATLGPLLDPARLKRVLFRSETQTRVKDLTAWRKTFDLPEQARPSAQKFIARLAQPDVQADLDAVFEAAREHQGYKRKDVEVTTGPDGFGTVRTPDFEYSVGVLLWDEDPSKIVWRREVGQIVDVEFLRGSGFETLFGTAFDQLVFEFGTPVDVGELVDRLEDHPPKGTKVQIASDGTSCDITLTGFVGRVTVERHSLIVRGRRGDSAGLLDQFLRFLQTVGPLGEPRALPGKGSR